MILHLKLEGSVEFGMLALLRFLDLAQFGEQSPSSESSNPKTNGE